MSDQAPPCVVCAIINGEATAEMIDEGTIRTTLTQELGPISAATLREAHGLVEQGRMVGKIVVSGW